MDAKKFMREVEIWVERSIYNINSKENRPGLIARLRIKNLAYKILDMDDQGLSDYMGANYSIPEKNAREFMDGTRPYRACFQMRPCRG